MSASIAMLLDESVKRFNDRPAIQYFCTKDNAWVTKSWQEIAKKVAKLACALSELGVASQDRVAILSLTRPEWVIADLAILKNSAVSVPIYHSSLSDQISYILNDASANVIFVENDEQLKKLRRAQKEVKKLDKIIIFDDIKAPLEENEIYLKHLIENAGDHFESKPLGTNDIASLVYTSGTTGEPKGAMITHDNLLYCAEAIDKLGLLSINDVQLLFLPLAHIFARVLEVTWIRTGHLLAFAQSIEKVVDNMAEVRPTFMAGVPRIFEKVRAKIMNTAASSGFVKAKIAGFAFAQAEALAHGQEVNHIKLALAKKLVFDKVGARLKERFGGRLRYLISGGAKLAPEVAVFFELCGIVLCEGYGLTETSAASCLNLPWAMRLNTVGRPLPGTEVRLDADGEILIRGRGVFKGFWRMEEKTKEVLDQDGWLHTGDIGQVDVDGFVRIVDRKKDLIITSQGKKVAPARLENLVKSGSPVIAYLVVIGDGLPYISALLALDKANALELLPAAEQDKFKSGENLFQHPKVLSEVKKAIDAANISLASFEQIKRFHVLPDEFRIGVELTPTLKIKRRECIRMFRKQIDKLYT